MLRVIDGQSRNILLFTEGKSDYLWKYHSQKDYFAIFTSFMFDLSKSKMQWGDRFTVEEPFGVFLK